MALPRSILKSAEQLGHHGFTRVYSHIHKALGSPRLYPGLFPHSTYTHDANLSIRLHNRVYCITIIKRASHTYQ
ncbi:hypothetical protein RHMOL_Rhmol08G0160500 [Rhododendron molle]|nr:hypothetical protein RHMOL_Rhmol08G0160500 [Rhododendron molle]